MKNIVEIAKKFAIKAHKDSNNTYGGKPYDYHLSMSVDMAMLFIHLISEDDRDNVIAALWNHDTLEDCDVTYNDLLKVTNKLVAEMSYALTNEKGRTRKDRANSKYYKGIRNTKYATFGKVCDRLANIKHSSDTGSRMFKMYKKENDVFRKELKSSWLRRTWRRMFFDVEPNYDVMWEYMDRLLKK